MVVIYKFFWILLTFVDYQITQTNGYTRFIDHIDIEKREIHNSTATKFEQEKSSTSSSSQPSDGELSNEENKEEVNVHELLDRQNQTDSNNLTEISHAPTYRLDWAFTDKHTIRVIFDLFKLPTNLVKKHRHLNDDDENLNVLATMISMPTSTLDSMFSLQYFLFTIRSYKSDKEVHLKLDKLHLKENNQSNSKYYSNTLILTALNHKEKYTICIFYFQTNTSLIGPDLVLCQDIINDYSKFADLKADAKHGLLFILTQYSIIIVLLGILQSSFTMRKRHVPETILHQFSSTAHNIRTTLSSVSLVRQSFSSFDHTENHASNGHATAREPTINEEDVVENEQITSPAIVISEVNSSNQRETGSICEENQPFLRKIPSKNHVHFLLGPGEGSDEESDNDISFDPIRRDSHLDSTRKSSIQAEPYEDQTDALLSMAHILDTNKPWSRHNLDPNFV